jgi:sugar fermentation stimulation protein A
VKLADGTTEATFISRQGRFTCVVGLPGGGERVYLANSGRLDGVLVPGETVFLAERSSPQRRTRYDLVAARVGGTVVSLDARVAAELVHQALLEGSLKPFAGYNSVRREVSRGRSRLDFLLTGPDSHCFVEVKSVTLAREGRALFPDAPTLRGRRQVESLTWAAREGYAAAIVFVVQRGDVDGFAPNDIVDPAFGAALRTARRHGVGVYAYRCRVSPEEVHLAGELAVYL